MANCIQMLQEYLTMLGSIASLRLQENHLSNQSEIFHELDRILENPDISEIQLNLVDISKVNSTAIGRLIYLKRYVENEKSRKFSMTNIGHQTLKTLKSVKVDGALGIGN